MKIQRRRNETEFHRTTPEVGITSSSPRLLPPESIHRSQSRSHPGQVDIVSSLVFSKWGPIRRRRTCARAQELFSYSFLGGRVMLVGFARLSFARLIELDICRVLVYGPIGTTIFGFFQPPNTQTEVSGVYLQACSRYCNLASSRNSLASHQLLIEDSCSMCGKRDQCHHGVMARWLRYRTLSWIHFRAYKP
ncbi:hypothetical protein DY000_02020979 [Brassica cretica]|uniref:Uncharacterized protein n=1 Tax=Brassica cretica TaxID=69181 RepID=A0ABQ7EDZ2_BRACR|nr:hypothetical protein DY000_02020979 [Brassica cretica]